MCANNTKRLIKLQFFVENMKSEKCGEILNKSKNDTYILQFNCFLLPKNNNPNYKSKVFLTFKLKQYTFERMANIESRFNSD